MPDAADIFPNNIFTVLYNIISVLFFTHMPVPSVVCNVYNTRYFTVAVNTESCTHCATVTNDINYISGVICYQPHKYLHKTSFLLVSRN